MIIQVKLLHNVSKIFTYSVPEFLYNQINQGSLIRVPLKNKIVSALVCHIFDRQQSFSFKIRSIVDVYKVPKDVFYYEFLQKIAKLYQVDVIIFLQRLHIMLEENELSDLEVHQALTVLNRVILTEQQQNAVDAISISITNNQHDVFVLHGVTASGKTEVYKRLIEQVLNKKQCIIVMMPEVSLAVQFEKIFKQYFQSALVFGFHCAASKKQKQELWNALLEQQPMIIVGVHMPILLPIAHLGLIIVDEEHDHGYQEKKHPKLHSRDMAILKASISKIPIVLGSATPSIATMHNVHKRGWKKLTMMQRHAGLFPQVSIVSMKEKKRKHFWFTQQLLEAISDRLNKKEQIIIFLNRRGFSFFVQCLCSFVFECKNCSVSLTLHDGYKMICHYCSYFEMMPDACPECNEKSSNFLKKGIGTQQVVVLLEKIFPQARIARADMDSTRQKKTWAQTVVMMQNQEIDILVGTQTITKGYHFPGVTLVGVLWADLNLHFPVYNAAEVCLQQLIQVAGRAGRQSAESLVIVQTFDDHPIFKFLNEVDYVKFYDFEIANRIKVGYPPFKHLAEIEIKSQDELFLHQVSMALYNQLKQYNNDQQSVEIFAPIRSVVHRVNHVHSQKIYLKSHSRVLMMQMFHHIKHNANVAIHFTVDVV